MIILKYILYFKIIIMIKFLLLCLIFQCTCHQPRMWARIPKYLVDDRVQNFLNQHRINNCYEFQESDTNLLLKCWKDEQLTDVSIQIKPGKRKQPQYYGISVSV
jgi:hypothetical protein